MILHITITNCQHSLLFLLPLSCMVAPIGKFANKFSFSTHFNKSNTASNHNNSLPPMSNRNNLGMDIQLGVSPTTNFEARGRNPSPSAKSSRDSSLASSGHSTPYHDRMEIDIDPRTVESNTESLELSYENTQEKEIRVSMAANHKTNQQAPTSLPVASMRQPPHMDNTRRTSSTSKFHTISTLLPNRNYGVDRFTLYLFMDL